MSTPMQIFLGIGVGLVVVLVIFVLAWYTTQGRTP